MTSRKLVVLLYYSVLGVFYTFALIHNFVYCRFPSTSLSDSITGKLQYLTVWCSVLQSVYFLLSSVNALQGFYSKNNNTALNGLCNRLYASLMFPIGMLSYLFGAFVVVKMVCVAFWAIMAVDRELVFPRILDEIIPQWQNHAMHTLPVITTLLDNYLVHHAYPKFATGVQLTVLLATAYLGLTFYVAYVHGIWLYPILRVMGFATRSAFFAGLCGTLFGVYKVGEWVNSLFWSSTVAKKRTQKTK